MKIDSGHIINDFIEPNKHQYAIPVYQRNYEWAKEQCKKLFDDIVLAYRNDKTHFCGTIVCAFTDESHGVYHHIIIDGQQRLTTVYLLIKALRDMAQTDSERDRLEEALVNRDKFDEYPIDEASKLKLKPIKSDNQQLSLLMENKQDQMMRDSGIWHNYELFCQLIQERQDAGMSVKDVYRGLEKLICAIIKLDSGDNAQEIFERINSTGIPLSLADKIRNYVLMVDSNQDALYEHYWLPAETAVGRENMNAFLIDYLNIKIDGFAREDIAYEFFKELYQKGKYSNESMLRELWHYARYYQAFLHGDAKYSARVNALLSDLQKLKQTTVFLFLFRVFDDYDDGVISEPELEQVLQFLRNYSIRRIICDVSSNSLRGLYKTLHARLFAFAANKLHYYDTLVSFFMQLTSKDALPTDDDFVSALIHSNLYRKNALCKFLLTAIENQGKEHMIVDNLTIEHILPQNKNLSTAWQTMLGPDWQTVRDQHLHTLGNLTLTAYNSELGDKTFAEKKQLLEDVQTKMVALYADVKPHAQWNAATIQARGERLASVIAGIFPITPPTALVSFSDPRYQEYSCDDPKTATYKTPNYFVLQGERIHCGTFADMLKSVISCLYSMDARIIESMARRNEQIVEWSQSVMFSYDQSKIS